MIQKINNNLPVWDVENGKTLCEDCHKLTNNYGRKLFKKEVKII